MSRLSIELTPEQHRAIKTLAALEGMKMKDFVLAKLFVKAAKNGAKPRVAEAGESCPLCEAYGGKNRKFSKRTQQAIAEAKSKKGLMRFASVEEAIASLRQ